MKKAIHLLLSFAILLFVVFSLFSCLIRDRVGDPTHQPMSKWTSDGYEFYVIDSQKGFLICNFEDKTVAYDVVFRYPGVMNLLDRRPQEVTFPDDIIMSDAYENPGYDVAIGTYHFSSDSAFGVTFRGAVVATDFPNDKIIFRRVATNLSPDDIPTIEIDSNFTYCPIYSIGSSWHSSDGRISIDVEGTLYPYDSHAFGRVTIADHATPNLCIFFSEITSSAYLGVSEVMNGYGDIVASDIWKCEFFEDRFVATVISSDYYESGTVLEFTKK